MSLELMSKHLSRKRELVIELSYTFTLLFFSLFFIVNTFLIHSFPHHFICFLFIISSFHQWITSIYYYFYFLSYFQTTLLISSLSLFYCLAKFHLVWFLDPKIFNLPILLFVCLIFPWIFFSNVFLVCFNYVVFLCINFHWWLLSSISFPFNLMYIFL